MDNFVGLLLTAAAGVLLTVLSLPSFGAGAKDVPRGVASWDANALGNHRARIQVSIDSGKADAVLIRIPWRRRDTNPQDKSIIVVDATTNKAITNVAPLRINREFGEIVFQPQTLPGEYYVYYMPFNPAVEWWVGTVQYQTFQSRPTPCCFSGKHGHRKTPETIIGKHPRSPG